MNLLRYVPLITMDKKVLNNFKNTATSIPGYIDKY